MIRQIQKLGIRMDRAGSGRFGAPRGQRAHKGVDFECTPGAPVLSPVSGYVENHGYAYATDSKWRIVNIRGRDNYRYRLFYVEPIVEPGDLVTPTSPVGLAMDITRRYPNSGMKPHVHFQIEDEHGDIVNPEALGHGLA